MHLSLSKVTTTWSPNRHVNEIVPFIHSELREQPLRFRWITRWWQAPRICHHHEEQRSGGLEDSSGDNAAESPHHGAHQESERIDTTRTSGKDKEHEEHRSGHVPALERLRGSLGD